MVVFGRERAGFGEEGGEGQGGVEGSRGELRGVGVLLRRVGRFACGCDRRKASESKGRAREVGALMRTLAVSLNNYRLCSSTERY